ncbi:MAG: hypothetical protein ACJ8EY_09665 [Sphingomicrobium sp.]
MASLPMRSWPQDAPRVSAPSAPALVPVPAVEQPARLSALEWSIVAMAERDSVASLREPGRFLTALGSLFGVRRTNRLANDQLEALRRVSVLAWRHNWSVPKSELRNFFAAGFAPDHYELIQRSIGQARAAHRRKTTR